VAYGLERGLRRQPAGFVLAGVALALQVLCGHAHPPLLSGLLAPLYVLGRGRQVHEPDRAGAWQVPAALAGLLALLAAAVTSSAARWLLLPGLVGGTYSLRGLLTTPARRAYGTSFAGLGAAFAVAGLLSAVQVLPLLELVPHTARQGGVEADRAQDPELTLTWARLGTLLLPRLHGSTYQADVGEKTRWDATHWEHAAHVGILTVLLLVLSPWLGRRRERWVFCALAALALVLAMGQAFPFYGWLAHLPGWGAVRGPARLLGLFAFAAAVSAGLTIDDLARYGLPLGPVRKRLKLVLYPTALLGVLAAVTMIVTVAGRAPFSPHHATAYTLAWVRLAALLVCGALLLGSRREPAPSPGWAALAAMLLLLDLTTGSAGYHRVKPASYFARPAAADQVRPTGGANRVGRLCRASAPGQPSPALPAGRERRDLHPLGACAAAADRRTVAAESGYGACGSLAIAAAPRLHVAAGRRATRRPGPGPGSGWPSGATVPRSLDHAALALRADRRRGAAADRPAGLAA